MRRLDSRTVFDDEADAVAESALLLQRRLLGKSGFAHASQSLQRNQARLEAIQQPDQLRRLILAANHRSSYQPGVGHYPGTPMPLFKLPAPDLISS